jgi:hypothetical protein
VHFAYNWFGQEQSRTENYHGEQMLAQELEGKIGKHQANQKIEKNKASSEVK